MPCRLTCFNFAYVLPQQEGKPIRVIVPLALQMRWAESPPLFCAVTELARDLIQHLVDKAVTFPPLQAMPTCARPAVPTKILQVYSDDFCFAMMQSSDKTYIPMIR